MTYVQDEADSTEQKNNTEEAAEDVDLFAKTDETVMGKTDETEEEEDLFAVDKSSSVEKLPSQIKGFSIFGTNDNEDDEDINNLFVPAGADEKTKVGIEIEDNSQLLK